MLHNMTKTNKKENMADLSELEQSNIQFSLDHEESPMFCLFMNLLKLFISMFAAYLSWKCSGSYSTPVRVLFAILAAICGSFYILAFVIFRSDLCKVMK